MILDISLIMPTAKLQSSRHYRLVAVRPHLRSKSVWLVHNRIWEERKSRQCHLKARLPREVISRMRQMHTPEMFPMTALMGME